MAFPGGFGGIGGAGAGGTGATAGLNEQEQAMVKMVFSPPFSFKPVTAYLTTRSEFCTIQNPKCKEGRGDRRNENNIVIL
jgi:hypothetical protein